MKPKNRRFDRAHRRTFIEILDRTIENGGDRAAQVLLGLSPEEWAPLVQGAVDASFNALHGSNGSYRKMLEIRLTMGLTRADVVLKAKGAFDELGLKRYEYCLDRKVSKPSPETAVILERIYAPHKIDELFAKSTTT